MRNKVSSIPSSLKIVDQPNLIPAVNNIPSLLKIKNFCQKYAGAFSEGGMRALIFNADSNGLNASGAIVRVGRKILIDEIKFFDWIRSRQNGGAK